MKAEKNYIPGSISFAEGFLGPSGPCKTYTMEYSHIKAQKIIEKLLDEGADIVEATAGLDGDFRENSCIIYDSLGFHDYDVYSGSVWAEPIVVITFNDRPSETYSVWTKK